MSEPLIACPNCKRADGLNEQAIRPTSQPINGLRADGDADSYDSFDYGDDVIVVGYSCARCGWLDAADLSRGELERMDRYVTELRARMPRTSEPTCKHCGSPASAHDEVDHRCPDD